MKMFCLECQNEWRSGGADRSRYRCPNCGTYDVMPVLPRRVIPRRKAPSNRFASRNEKAESNG